MKFLEKTERIPTLPFYLCVFLRFRFARAYSNASALSVPIPTLPLCSCRFQRLRSVCPYSNAFRSVCSYSNDFRSVCAYSNDFRSVCAYSNDFRSTCACSNAFRSICSLCASKCSTAPLALDAISLASAEHKNAPKQNLLPRSVRIFEKIEKTRIQIPKINRIWMRVWW